MKQQTAVVLYCECASQSAVWVFFYLSPGCKGSMGGLVRPLKQRDEAGVK